jgi:hypothetical protein
MMKHLAQINIEDIIEDDDNTKLVQEAACAGGACALTSVS